MLYIDKIIIKIKKQRRFIRLTVNLLSKNKFKIKK